MGRLGRSEVGGGDVVVFGLVWNFVQIGVLLSMLLKQFFLDVATL